MNSLNSFLNKKSFTALGTPHCIDPLTFRLVLSKRREVYSRFPYSRTKFSYFNVVLTLPGYVRTRIGIFAAASSLRQPRTVHLAFVACP